MPSRSHLQAADDEATVGRTETDDAGTGLIRDRIERANGGFSRNGNRFNGITGYFLDSKIHPG